MLERTQNKLAREAHPLFAHIMRRLLPRFSAVIPGNERQQWSAETHEVFRLLTRQEALYAQGRTTPGEIVTHARGWDSWHTVAPVGLCVAADVVPFNHEKQVFEWLNPAVTAYADMWQCWGELGRAVGLEAGARWKRRDFPHFNLDLAPFSPSEFYREFKDQPAALVSQAITRIWRQNHPEAYAAIEQEMEAIRLTPIA